MIFPIKSKSSDSGIFHWISQTEAEQIQTERKLVMKTILALDVGGTEIKSCIYRENGEALGVPRHTPAKSQLSAEEIEKNFCSIIQAELDTAEHLGEQISDAGLAFPGPFDYENGICLMQGIGKYDSLYKVNVHSMLKRQFPALNFAFANDADLFGLGEYFFSGKTQPSRVFYLCIGTGIGSCFIEDGKLIKEWEDVPEHGWIYHTPCRDGIADQYLSCSALLRMAQKEQGLAAFQDGKALSQAAMDGNTAAQKVFSEFGKLFTETVMPFAYRFQAGRIVIGGQIAHSFPLFGDTLARAAKENKIKLDTCPNSSEYASKGVIRLFM